MATETAPKYDQDLVNRYEASRKDVVGGRLLRSGGKAFVVGALAAGAVLASAVTISVTAGAGLFAAAGLAGYGGGKMIEGAANKVRAWSHFRKGAKSSSH